MRKILASVFSIVFLVSGFAVPASANLGQVEGGWREDGGYFTSPTPSTSSDRVASAARGSVNHRGKAEEKIIRGTTHKRSHGWTTWKGVRHYTPARLEHYHGGGVIISSGRQWGVNGTEAVTKWRAFNPHAKSNGYGTARTYYGR